MKFRILGAVEVLDGEEALELGGAKQRSLLALLLLNANRVVSTARLIDALWDDAPPQTARKALQGYVSQLRKLLGPDRLQTHAAGYVLRVDPDELDLATFERLREEGRPVEALELWRGPPLADLVTHRFTHGEIVRLEELRSACLEDRIDADLAAGRHLNLVGELESLVSERPLRERLRGQLMLALYRSGRQAEALRAYQDARTVLVEELGIEPSRFLRELEQAILRQDAALDLARDEEAVGSSPAPFVGRERELAALARALADAAAGRGRLLLLAGEPGIGKSRLVDELINRARAHGCRVLAGRCWEDGGAPAYWPWVQCLRPHLRDASPDELRRQLGRRAAVLAQVFPELVERFPDLSPPAADGSEASRFRLFDAASGFVLQLARVQPLVLVLDDLHAADEPSLLLLRFLARELRDANVLVVAAYRDVDPHLRDPLASTIRALVREAGAERLTLTGLAEDEVAAYIALATGEAPESKLVGAIHARTDGNPLFVAETVRALPGGAHVDAAGEPTPVPHGVRDAIERRLERLSAGCRTAMQHGAVLGVEFGVAELGRLGAAPADELAEALDEAMTERVVVEVAGSQGRLRFTHALIRDVLYEQLSLPRRLRLHRQVGTALEGMYGPRVERHLARVAFHFLEAARDGDAAAAVAYARRAGDQALGQLAFEEAARLYAAALAVSETDERVHDASRAELLLALADAQTRAGELAAARASALAAAQLARRNGDVERLARAPLAYGGRMVVHAAVDDEELIHLLEEALGLLGDDDSELRVRLLSRLAGALRGRPERETRLELSGEAVRMARRLGEPRTLAYALDARLGATWWPQNHDERLALADELVTLASRSGDRQREFFGRGHRMYALLELGDLEAADRELERRAELAAGLQQAGELWLVAANRCLRALLAGRFDVAESLIPSIEAAGARVQRRDALVALRHQLFVLRRAQGRLHEIADIVVGGVPAAPWLRPLALTDLGRLDEAQAALDALAADDFAAIPPDNEWLLGACLVAEASNLLDDRACAAALYEKVLPYGGLNVVSAPEVCIGSAARYLGLLAATLSRFDEAERWFGAAAELNERMRASPWVAHGCEDRARMLLARGRAGDAERAAELLESARATYARLGMAGPLAKCSAVAAAR